MHIEYRKLYIQLVKTSFFPILIPVKIFHSSSLKRNILCDKTNQPARYQLKPYTENIDNTKILQFPQTGEKKKNWNISDKRYIRNFTFEIEFCSSKR